MPFDKKKFGDKLARLRKLNNLTQMELADKARISYRNEQSMEYGTSRYRMADVMSIAEILGTTVSDMLDEAPPEINSYEYRIIKALRQAGKADVKVVLRVLGLEDETAVEVEKEQGSQRDLIQQVANNPEFQQQLVQMLLKGFNPHK